MKVLVTGAGGFSGSVIALSLASRGHEVTALLGRTHARLPADAAQRGLKPVQADLSRDTLPEMPFDAIVHAAARSPAPGTTADDFHSANVVGTERIVAHARRCKVKAVVYLSSLSVYGEITAPVVDEATPIVNPDAYGVTKLRGERLIAEATDAFHSIAIRLPGVLGRGSVRNWLTGVLARAKLGDVIEIYNAHAPFNNAIHVDDLAAFVGDLLERKWRGFDAVTVAAGGAMTVQQVVQLIVAGTGSRSSIHVRPERRHSFTVSSERATRRHGYRPSAIDDVLRRFVAQSLSA